MFGGRLIQSEPGIEGCCDQLTVVGYGLDVPQATLLVSVTEVVPQDGGRIEGSGTPRSLLWCAPGPPPDHRASARAQLLRSDIHK